MAWLDRLLSAVFQKHLAGHRLEDPNPIALRLPHEPARFIRALPELAGPSAFLYCEGTTEGYVADWLKDHCVEPRLKIALGTLMPPSDTYHIPLQPDLLTEFAILIDARRILVPVIHVHLYDDDRVMLEWHDAFGDDPVLLSHRLPLERIRAFMRATLGEPVDV
jgi:hypothetical protein